MAAGARASRPANGPIWLGFTTIMADAYDLQTQATLNSTLSGTWHEIGGASGTFTPTSVSGNPRPKSVATDTVARGTPWNHLRSPSWNKL